jgi:hypothetical protein
MNANRRVANVSKDRGSSEGQRAFGRIVLCRWDVREIVVVRYDVIAKCVPQG